MQKKPARANRKHLRANQNDNEEETAATTEISLSFYIPNSFTPDSTQTHTIPIINERHTWYHHMNTNDNLKGIALCLSGSQDANNFY